MGQNKKVNTVLKMIESKMDSAKTHDDIHAAAEIVTRAPIRVTYFHTHYYAAIAGMMVAITACLYAYFHHSVDWASIVAMVMVIPILTLIVIMVSRHRKINTVIKQLRDADLFYDNDLTPARIPSVKKLSKLFYEFRRGNHSREIIKCFKSKGGYCYHFNYIDRRTKVVMVQDRRGVLTPQTQEVFDTYDRYGLILQGMHTKQVLVYSDKPTGAVYPESFAPTSTAFRKKFTVVSAKSIDAAKFLRPAVVLEMISVATALDDLNIEFDRNGTCCISFTTNILQGSSDPSNRPSISNAVEFVEEIKARQEMPVLATARAFADNISRLTDSNFD